MKIETLHLVLAMKPLEGTFAQNALSNGVAGINIDGGRIGTGDRRMCGTTKISGKTSIILGKREETRVTRGRFPANVILAEAAAKMLDEQSGHLISGAMKGIYQNTIMRNEPGVRNGKSVLLEQNASSGGASRFFWNFDED